MLEELRISGLGVISDAVLELGPGFSVLTGETGAGKTMVVTGLSLLLGGRADVGLIRTGSDRLTIDGRFAAVPAAVAARLAELDAIVEDDAVLIGRTLGRDGRSRAHLGGRAVPVAVLAELGELLVARHGQADQLRLARPAAQRDALDTYGSLLELRDTYIERYTRGRAIAAEIESLHTSERDRLLELDTLRHGLDAIHDVAPQPGEDETIAALVAKLAHAEALQLAAATAHAALSGEDAAALELVAVARRAIETAAGHDAALAGLGERLADASYLLSDIAAELASYATSVEADPSALAAAQERQAALTGLCRRYGPSLAEVFAWAAEAEQRSARLTDASTRLPALTEAAAALATELADAAAELTTARGAAALALSSAITAELHELAMPDAELTVAVTPAASAGPFGADDVTFQFSARPGAPPRPLGRSASGGELSRIMLAVEAVLAGARADPVPTFVFDEVDAGVGGRAAVEVGRRLAGLAAAAQVLAVTHLPQVAAFADRHFVVTATGVQLVEGADRVTELSRMLAGLADSELGRGHAEELLEVAAAAKAGSG